MAEDKLKVGQKVYTFGGMGLPRGMVTVVGISKRGGGYAVKDSAGDTWGAVRHELLNERDAIRHAYEIFKGFS